MEDDNGLELSLAPPSAGEASTTKDKIGISSDTRSDINDRDTKLINEFKQFLDGGNMQIHSGIPSQRADVVKPENFFNNLSNIPIDVDTSKNLSSGAFWAVKEQDANRTDIHEKRKNVFGETTQQKRCEKESDRTDSHDKPRVSYITLNTDDGSAAENEDVADSEADASTSKQLLLQQHDVASRYTGTVFSISESNVGELAGQKRLSISSEKEFKFGNLPRTVRIPTQPVNIVNMSQPPVKDSNPTAAPSRASYSLPSMMQVIAATNGDRTGSQPLMPTNLPLVASYSPAQLPPLDKDNSRTMISHQQVQPLFIGRSSDKYSDGLKMTQGISQKLSDSKQHKGKAVDHHIGNGKLVVEGGASSQTEDDANAVKTSFRSKDGLEPCRTEGFPSEYPTIKAGIAADLKFGGSGSYPNLPWVSTTSSGANGRTISGVTYRYSPMQIKIVCACHGLHMSPEEFVRHASVEPSVPDAGTGVLPNGNPATSAQS